MINEIKRRLDAGKKVELECIDRDGFVSNEINRTANMLILNQESLIVQVVHEEVERVVLEGVISPVTSNTINFDELKFFKIKEQNFDDLIKEAVNAVRNNIIQSFERIQSLEYAKSITERNLIFLIKHDGERVVFGYDQAQDGINYLESLATETFVIESPDNILNCKGGANIVFSNGAKAEFLEPYNNGKKAGILFLDSGTGFNIPFELLKGATVTQKR